MENKNYNQMTETGLTRQREAVLQVIRNNDTHLTASEVYELARLTLPTISYATVYNSLRYLKEVGLIDEVQFGNGASRYDRMTERHDHAICTKCGKLVDLELEFSDELMQMAADRSGFAPQSIQMTLKGLCSECRS